MTSPNVADCLHLSHGITPDEFDQVVASLDRLDERLKSFKEGSVTLELSVKERDTPSQRTTLEASIAGHPRLIATSKRTDLDGALQEVRDDLIRQITDAKNRTEPRNNPALRKKL